MSPRKRAPGLKKGDLVKQKALGGHVMTVIEVSKDGRSLIGSYSTPDSEKHAEHWLTEQLKRVPI